MKKLILVTFLLLNLLVLNAQTFKRNIENQHHVWFTYMGDHQFADKWGVHLEAQIRRADVIKEWQQLLLRTAINYHVTNNAFVSLGYGFIDTYPYGELPVSYRFPEHRIYQQLQVKDDVGVVELQHRFRLEQRWLENAGVGSHEAGAWNYLNRFRYFLRASVPLKGKTIDNKEFYLTAYNEFFIAFGKNVQYNVFDQNRAYLALGYKFGKAGKLEVGYLNQFVARGIRTVTGLGPNSYLNTQNWENNNTFIVGWYSNIPFYKKEQ